MVTQESSRLGVCPVCGEEVLSRHVLISYETESGETDVWAECPDCHDVVHPR
ncbi:DUF7837 family putative zinc-binding protein [Halosimplex sp. J119]